MPAIVLLIMLVLAGVNLAAWTTNAVWLYHHLNAAINLETIIAAVGVLAVPLGVLHGLFVWFV